MRPALTVTLLVALLASLGGCRTTSIGPPLTLPIPSIISQEEAETSIALFLTASKNEGTQEHYLTRIRRSPFGATLLDSYREDRGLVARELFLESWETGLLRVGYQLKQYYLRVAIEISDRSASLSIEDSRHLHQSRKRIHKRAKIWLEMLESNVRYALGQAVLVKRGLQSMPETPSN